MTKLVFVLDNMIYGGIERVAINYLKSLDPSKYSIDIIILDPKTEKIVEEIPSYCNIKYLQVPRWVCPELFWQLGIKYKGAIVLYPIMYLIMQLVTLLYKVRMINYPQYDIAIAFSGHVNDLHVVKRLLKSRKKVAWLHGALYQYILLSPAFEKLYDSFDRKVVLCQHAEEEVYMYKPWLKQNTLKIWNPIPKYEYNNVNQENTSILRSKYKDYILMVGRMNYPHKDHYTVIDAVNILKSEYGLDKKVVFLGDGPNMEYVKEYAKKLGIESNTIFEGTKSNVEDYYSSAKMLVHSSVAGEGLPTVILEAMACGLPVVSTDSQVGPREIIGDEEYGLLCEVKNSKQMASKIAQLYNDNEKCQKYIKAGENRIKDFLPESIIPQFENMIAELLKY